MKWQRINIKLLPVKIHYFVFMAGLACALPFRTVFAKQLGISATAVGVIFLAVPFLKIITNPFFGFILDYFKKFRLTIGVLLFIVAMTHVAMVFITPVPPGKTDNPATFSAKLNFTTYMNASKKSERKFKLIIDSIFQSSNGKFQEFICNLKCSKGNFSTIKEELKEKVYKQSCNRSLSFEMKISVEIRACEMDIFLTSGKLLMNTDISINHLLFKKDESIELPSNLKTHQKSSECLKVVHHALHSNNYSLSILEKISNEYAFNHSDISHIPIKLQNMLKTSNSEEKATDECKDILTFFKMKAYDINVRTCEKYVEDFIEVQPCKKEEFECVSTECLPNYANQQIAVEMQKDEFMTVQFWGIFTLIAISSVTFCAVMFLMDTICYEMLYDKNETYGEQRLWGTVGWGLGALAGGYLNQIISVDSSNIDYAPSFYLLAILTILDLIPLYFIEVGNVKYSSSICKDVGILLSKFDVVINIAIVFMVGVLSGLIWNYQFWFMEEIGASQILLGLSQTFECLLAELPCFVVSGWIIRKLGYNHCNSITFLCFGLRYLCFAYMYNPWMTLPLALLHGPTFGLFYASMITYGKSEAPPGTEATVQALLSMSFEGVGAATGSILGGIGFDEFGSRTTFFYAAVASFILLIMNVILHATVLKQDKNKRMEKELPDCYKRDSIHTDNPLTI